MSMCLLLPGQGVGMQIKSSLGVFFRDAVATGALGDVVALREHAIPNTDAFQGLNPSTVTLT